MTRVARIVEKKRPPKSFGQTCSNHLSLTRNLIFSFINKRVVLVPIVFLIGYYILQIAYQLDFGLLGMLCPNELWNEDECSPKDGSMSLFGPNNTLQPNPEMLTKCCRKWVKVKYAEWEKRMAALTNLLTFLFKFKTTQQLKEKGLLKDREISELKVREVIWNKKRLFISFVRSSSV